MPAFWLYWRSLSGIITCKFQQILYFKLVDFVIVREEDTDKLRTSVLFPKLLYMRFPSANTNQDALACKCFIFKLLTGSRVGYVSDLTNGSLKSVHMLDASVPKRPSYNQSPDKSPVLLHWGVRHLTVWVFPSLFLWRLAGMNSPPPAAMKKQETERRTTR